MLLSERRFIPSTVGTVCVFARAYVLHGEVKQSMQPSLTAVGQACHVTAGDQCQTGKVTGLRSPSLHSFKKSCGQKK